MIERVLLDAAGNPLLSLFRHSRAQALLPLEESFPELSPVGRVEEVAGTGVRFFVGGDALTAGNYTLTLGTYGQTHGDNFALQRAVMGAAVLTRAIQRNGSTLPIVRFAKIARTLRGGAQFSGQMTLEFVPASAYWLADSRSVTVEGQQVVHVGGMAPAALRVTFTGPVINPYIVTPAGTTRWIGTVPAGADLVIDARPGRWTVTLSGAAVQLRLQGPQPYLEPGSQMVTVSGAAKLEWQEGVL